MTAPINWKSLARLDADFERILRALHASHDLTTRQVRALLMIGKASSEGEPLTCNDLKRYLGLASQTASNTVHRFVELGYLRQERCESDARVKHLVLTDEGKEALRRMSEC
jgi:DNA-binding MarR family transcriptional regulator